MIRIVESQTAVVGKVKTTFYVAIVEEDLYSKKLHQALCGFSSCENSSANLIRMGHILSLADVDELIAILDYLQQKEGRILPRVVSQQLQRPESDYSAILWQHLYLLSDSRLSNLGHLDLRSAPILKPKVGLTLPGEQNLAILGKLVNDDSWLRYCDWFNEELEKIPFNLDMLDIFQVEARASDLAHEIKSPILLVFRKKIVEIATQTATEVVHSTSDELIKGILTESETKLYKLRMSIQENLQNICECLVDLVKYIENVEKFHPELIPLKNQATLLNLLISEDLDFYYPSHMTWIRRILLLSLLDCLLGVVPIINCAFEDDRTSVGFAIKQAVIQLVQQGKMDSLLHLALNWDQAILRINACCLEKGIDAFEKWIREDIQENEDKELHQEALLAHQLRLCVYKNLQNFCFPFIQINESLSSINLEDIVERIETDYLDLIPEQLVVYDPKTFKALKLNQEGAKRLLPLLLKVD